MRRYGQEIADDAEKGEVMRYKVTFAGGQVSTYDTKTPFEEFKACFPSAVAFENLDEQPVIKQSTLSAAGEVVAPEDQPVVKPTRTRKSAK